MKSNSRYRPENRVKETSDFQKIYRQGHKISGYYYTAFFMPSSFNESRLGISVPKRLGNAVFRNRQKRVIREYFRKEIRNFSMPIDVIFVSMNPPGAYPKSQTIELNRIIRWLIEFKIS